MNEIIKNWKQFRKEWYEKQPLIDYGEGQKGRLKPTFYDFMEWLSK